MAKSLVDKLQDGFRSIRRNFKSIILSATAGLFLYGAQCVPNPPPTPPDPENNPPTANLYVSPNYGQAPLPVSIKLDGDDKNGIENIVEYEVFIDREGTLNDETIWQLNPINITRDFYESAIVEGKVTDSAGATDKKIVAVNVYQPGDPTLDLGNVTGTTLTEEQESYITNLPTNDKEGNPITYNNIGLSQNIEYANLENNDSIKIKSNNITRNENYTINLTFTDNITGKTGTAILQGEIYNLIDISGRLEDNETDSNQAGVIRVYDSSDNSLLEEISTSDGDFGPLQLNKRVSQAIVQARVEEGGVPKSYVRTVRLDGDKDYSNLIVRVVPYPDFDTNGDTLVNQTDYENYKRHIGMTNIGIFPEIGLKKWDLEGKIASENALKGIVIFQTNPINGSSFTTGSGSQYEIITIKIKDPNDIEVCIRGSNLPDTDPTDGNDFPDLDSFVLIGEPKVGVHYTIFSGDTIIPEPGYILVAPDNTLDPGIGGDTKVRYYQGNLTTGIINRVLIRIKPSIENGDFFKRVVSHEFKHAFTNPYDLITLDNPGDPTYPTYDAQTLAPNLTILRYDTPNITIGQGEADKEDPYIINEESYQPAEKSDDILGMDFY